MDKSSYHEADAPLLVRHLYPGASFLVKKNETSSSADIRTVAALYLHWRYYFLDTESHDRKLHGFFRSCSRFETLHGVSIFNAILRILLKSPYHNHDQLSLRLFATCDSSTSPSPSRRSPLAKETLLIGEGGGSC